MSNLDFDSNVKLWRAVVWTLRISVSLQCLGFARDALLLGTPLFSYLWNDPVVGGLGWPESSAVLTHQIAGWSLLIAAVMTLMRPCWPVLIPVVLWQLSLAIANMWMGGNRFYEISLLTQSTRILAPVGLLLIDPWPRRMILTESRVAAAMQLLRIAVAVTFSVHGYEALKLHPQFVDFVIVVSHRLFGLSVPESVAETIVFTIGVVDVLVGVLLLATRWRAVAYYMAFWGLITASARILYGGIQEIDWTYHQTLSRACHAGVPLAIGLYWTMLSRGVTQGPPTAPSSTEESNVYPSDDTHVS